MVPALLQAMSEHDDSKWTSYAKMASLVAMPKISIVVASCAIALSMDETLQTDYSAFLYPLLWLSLDVITRTNLSETFTYAKMHSVNSLLAHSHRVDENCYGRFSFRDQPCRYRAWVFVGVSSGSPVWKRGMLHSLRCHFYAANTLVLQDRTQCGETAVDGGTLDMGDAAPD
jgi:hypothetical protein